MLLAPIAVKEPTRLVSIFVMDLVGLVLALVSALLIASLLYGVDAGDPLTLATVVVVLAAVSLVACWLPARRAARLDPVVVLRGD